MFCGEADVKHPSFLRCISYHGLSEGPRVIILGAVHGNEPCGTLAIRRFMESLDSGERRLLKGTLSFVPVANPLAWQQHTRMGERNLNRNFRISDNPEDFEDRITNRLAHLLQAHDLLLDIHSFHTQGQPFVMLGPRDNEDPLERFSRAREEEALAARIGVRRMVEGWLNTYARGVARRMGNPNASLKAQMLSTHPSYGIGTTEFIRAQGGYALTLECGQHDDPNAIEVGHQAIINTLSHLGMLDEPEPPRRSDVEVLRLVEVVDRDHPEDVFIRDWNSFDTLKSGQLIGHRHDGTPVVAPGDGFIVFPNPTALPGNEWFYLAVLSDRAECF